MPPPNLQGLNIVHPAQPVSDAQDLLSGPPFPDLAAQLDLWTNLAFDSDESPLNSRHDDDNYNKHRTGEEEEEDVPSSNGSGSGEAAIHDGHINVVTGTNIDNNHAHPNHAPTSHSPQAFDLNAFLAGYGIDPFSAPPVPSSSIAPSIAQLLALHSAHAASAFTAPHPVITSAGEKPSSFSRTLPTTTTTPASTSGGDDTFHPIAKRPRTRKQSVSVTEESPESYQDEPSASASSPSSSTPLSAAEDKRRRNTAASARFRLKKKEREAALEGKAKELETRVNELERECEGLRRENGWLKGLVVGVTGAAQGSQAVNTATTVPPPSTASTTTNAVAVGHGIKRGRDEVEV